MLCSVGIATVQSTRDAPCCDTWDQHHGVVGWCVLDLQAVCVCGIHAEPDIAVGGLESCGRVQKGRTLESELIGWDALVGASRTLAI